LSAADGRGWLRRTLESKKTLTTVEPLDVLAGVELRTAHIGDLAALVRLDRLCFGKRAWSARGWWEVLGEPGWTTMVLENKDGAVGAMVLLLGRPVASLASLAIVPAQRGRGLGQGMLRHAVTMAREARAQFLTLEVDLANHPARRLYRRERFGVARRFREDGRWRVEMHRRL
jgi:ribosomal protein S18 acetylase RimI-like enzyme